jgi:NADH pyrophosphatase NudC (nudix superfamily)
MEQLDPQLVTLFALTSGVGYLMVLSGVGKSMLDWKRHERHCPSCGRRPCGCE